MTTDPSDAIDDLAALLSAVEPSTTFAAGVRARIAAPSAAGVERTPWWVVWTAVGLAGAAAVVVVSSRVRGARPVPVTFAEPAALRAAESGSPVQPTEASAPISPAVARPGAAVDSLAPTAVVGQLGGHDVLVPADQRLALVRFLAGVRSGRATFPGPVVAAFDQDGLLLLPEPVVIAPLPDLMPSDPDGKNPVSDSKPVRKDKS